MFYKTLKQVSEFFNIPISVIRSRCIKLDIQCKKNHINQKIYSLSEKDIIKILTIDYNIQPKVVEKETIYNIYESKINKEND